MSRKALGRGLSALFTQNNPLEQDLVYIDIDQIEPTDAQPRQYFKQERLEELADSIKSNGIIQPIVVRRIEQGYQIIAGERRWRAAQLAGLHRVPCVVKNVPEENVLELSLIENIQREELTPIEEANAYKRLLERFEATQEEVARRVGKDRSTITNSLRLLKLPLEIQKMLEEGNISMGHARALLALEEVEQQVSLAQEIANKTLSVRDTEKQIKRILEKPDSASSRPEMIDQQQSNTANIKAAESKLSKRLAAPVKIKIHKEGGSIEIKFSSSEDLTRLFDLLIQRLSIEL